MDPSLRMGKMRKFNKQLNADITELKTLHMKKDKTEFNKMKEDIMKRHKISKATVYREMKKEQPGYYKRPQYNPPIRDITEKEKEIVSGKLFKQTPIEEIRAEMEKETGESYSWDRIDKIRDSIKKDKNAIPEDKIMNPVNCGSDFIEYESPHGEDMKLFLEKVMSIDKMEPRSFITIAVNGYGIRLGYDAVKDIQRYVANSAAGRGGDVNEVSKMNLKHLCNEQVRLFAQGKTHNVKDLSELGKMINGFESTGTRPGVDFEFIVDIVQHFAPKVKREDIVFAVTVQSGKYQGLSKEMEAPDDEARKAVYNWTSRHM